MATMSPEDAAKLEWLEREADQGNILTFEGQQQMATLREVRASMQTPAAREARYPVERNLAGGAGAIVGAGTGLATGGVRGAVKGGIAGWTGGETAVDLLEGRESPGRLALQVGAGALAAPAEGAGLLETAGRVGLGSAVAGLFHDIMEGFHGDRTSWRQRAWTALNDFTMGAFGGAMGAPDEPAQATRQTMRTERATAQTEQERMRAAYGEAGVTDLRASEIAGKRAERTAALETWPEKYAGGEQSREYERGRREQLSERGRGLISEGVPGSQRDTWITREEGAKGAQRGVAKDFEDWESHSRAAYSAIHNEPDIRNNNVVPTTNLRGVAQSVYAIGKRKPIGTEYSRKLITPTETIYEAQYQPGGFTSPTGPQGPQLFGPSGQPLPPGTAERPLLTSRAVDIPGGASGETNLVERGERGVGQPGQPVGPVEGVWEGEVVDGKTPEELIAIAVQHDKIPLWLAQRIKSELGQKAFTRGENQPVPGVTVRDAQKLYKAFQRDYDTFFESDVGKRIEPAFKQANAEYKAGKVLYNRTILRQFLKEGADPVRAFENAFSPGNITATRDLHHSLPPDAFNNAVQGFLHDKYLAHTTTDPLGREVFDAQGFWNEMKQYDDKGQLEVMVGKERASQFRNWGSVSNWMRVPIQPKVPEGALPGLGHRLSSLTPAPQIVSSLTQQPAVIDRLAGLALPRGPVPMPARIAGGVAVAPGLTSDVGQVPAALGSASERIKENLMPWWNPPSFGTPQ